MVNRPSAVELLVIVGPTASGKSAMAIDLAKALDGEILCADSRTVYKYMDIGTAKPSLNERKLIPHHLLDLVEPSQSFTVMDFKAAANRAIAEVQSRGNLPIMVGGSGLYVDSVIFDYSFGPLGAERDEKNPRHASKAAVGTKRALLPGTLVIGLSVPREILKQRITERVHKMVENGFLDEMESLIKKYDFEYKALQAPGYLAFGDYLAGKIDLDEAKRRFIKNDFELARKQMSWFRRNKNIHWLDDPNTYVNAALQLVHKMQ